MNWISARMYLPGAQAGQVVCKCMKDGISNRYYYIVAIYDSGIWIDTSDNEVIKNGLEVLSWAFLDD